MRNLRNTKHAKHKCSDNHRTPLAATAWDASDDSLVLGFGPTENDPAISLKRLQKDSVDLDDAISIASWDAPSPNPDFPVDHILDLHVFPDTKTISLVLAGGDIVIVREEPRSGEDVIEIVGSVDAGIHAAEWSPDEELLAVCTGADTLLFMTTNFESTANITLSPDDVEVSNHVSVGWGKKETQFKGRGVAKTLRDPTVPEHVDEGTLSPTDDGAVSISWRGDGQYVAVNRVLDVGPKRRIIRVYSREGQLDSVTEPVNGLGSALSWKPSGQIIASVRYQKANVDVVFFERNGLRHGEFSLRLDQDEITKTGARINLTWNVDSTVLAISMDDRVQLWTMGNYHYYLKQEIRFNGAARSMWHPEKALSLACFTSSDLHILSYRFEVCRGSITPPHDLGIVAVIDGKNMKITPLRTANAPPPMAFDEVELPHAALDVAIKEDGTEMAVLHPDSVSLWKFNYGLKPAARASMQSVVKSGEQKCNLEVTMNGTGRDDHNELSVVQDLYIRTDHDRIYYREHFDTEQQRAHGDTGRSSITDGIFQTTWRNDEDHEISFQLSDAGVLHIQSALQTLRVPSCTSYIVTLTHLIYTCGQHLLKFVHLRSSELQIPADEPEKDERCRNIERGAKIVTVMPSVYSLVLQMPRGNLETIYPRALVLAGIRESIRQRDYKKAFLTCRTHRVDMNILHDYLPSQFMEDINVILGQVKKTEWIDLVLSSLSDENVSQTIYRDTLTPVEEMVARGIQNGDNELKSASSSKVNDICNAFLRALRKQPSSRLQNIVTAHVCKNPPDLEAGLELVSELRKQGEQEKLEEAVEHICFLADVNQLYDTSLGLYDLDVALLVAQQSQKDPREYLPYLQSLHDMEFVDRQFKIDDDLKRHRKALAHLYTSGEFDEVKDYTVRHELYSEAVELYRYDDSRVKQLMRLHAEYLSSRNRFKESGIAYEYVGDHLSAYEAYRAVSMWRECLACAALVPLSSSELLSVAQDLSNSLEEAKDFESAATIHLDYLDDIEGAAGLLCKAYNFAESIRMLTVRQKTDLVRTVVDSGLVEASGTLTELLAEMKSQLGAQLPRLRELRQKKLDDPMAFLDGMEGGDGDVPDNISLAPTDASTSGGTFMTRYTNRSVGTLETNATRKTSKNRRREERKRARGKKGTVYEEEYLVNSIARLMERFNDICADTTKLIEGLVRRGMRERAVAVQASMDDVFAACENCIDEVFVSAPESARQTQETESADDTNRPWGGQGVLWEALKASGQERPVLKAFNRLALLP